MNPFLAAIDVLRERGWHQGAFEDEATGALCMEGALGIAHCGHVRAFDDNFSDLLNQLADQLGTAPFSFNDDAATSFEDVVLVLKHAAEAWDES